MTWLSLVLSGQAGEVDDRSAKHGRDGPEGGIPSFCTGAVVFDGRHGTASILVEADYIPRLFQNDYVGYPKWFRGRLSRSNSRDQEVASDADIGPEMPCS